MYVHMYIHASCISSQAFFREDISQFLDLQDFPQYIHIYIYRVYVYVYVYIYIYIHICGKLRGILSSDLTEFSQHPRCAIFPIPGLAEIFATSKLFFLIFGLAAVVITPELSIFYIFGRARAKSCHFQNFLKQLRMLHNIFSYFGKRHSKLSSVKTKTIHFLPFFEFREFPQHPNYPSFPYFLNSESSHNTQIINFSAFFAFREFAQHPNIYSVLYFSP